jgi:hypothetical protein
MVRATSTATDQTTSATYVNSSLSASITPTNSAAVFEIEVYGEVNQTWVTASPANILCWYQIYNSTDAVSVNEVVMGYNPTVGAAGAAYYNTLALRGYYTVNSTAARTFVLRHKSNVATNVQSDIRGDRGNGITMSIRQIA